MDISNLPEGCIATILSLTSPLDTFNSSLVSSSFRFAADSDLVWEKLLPSDYRQIIARSVHNLSFSSKKELYQRLSESILIDGGTKMFKIEKSSGKKSFILSARDLSITWSDDPMYWAWNSTPESRFSEVAQLRTTNWLEIHGTIKSTELSANTNYGAYLIMKTNKRSYGLDLVPSQVSITIQNRLVSSTASYLCSKDIKKHQMEHLFYANRAQIVNSGDEEERKEPVGRGDGWTEIKIGEFLAEGCEEEIKMSVREVEGYQLKGGIVIEGIEVRPI